jgi:hypothetical protein
MSLVFRLLRWAIAAALAFGVVTWVALEGNDVATLRTIDGENRPRETHVWVADAGDGSLWIEAATPDRPWLADIRHNPKVELDRVGASGRWRAVPVEGPEARETVRALLSAKYGWADWWVGLLQDTSQAVAVRLDPRP